MTNTKSKKKAPAAKHPKTPAQFLSHKKTTTKSRASSHSTAIRTSLATSRGTSQQATVEPSEDDDDEADHIGGTLDVNRDMIMEPVDLSESEQEEDDKSELSETCPVIYLVSCRTDDQQKNLPRIGWHLSMPSSGLFLTLSMLKATVATSFNVLPRAVNINQGGLEDSLIQGKSTGNMHKHAKCWTAEVVASADKAKDAKEVRTTTVKGFLDPQLIMAAFE